jgi:hypothetical protein
LTIFNKDVFEVSGNEISAKIGEIETKFCEKVTKFTYNMSKVIAGAQHYCDTASAPVLKKMFGLHVKCTVFYLSKIIQASWPFYRLQLGFFLLASLVLQRRCEQKMRELQGTTGRKQLMQFPLLTGEQFSCKAWKNFEFRKRLCHK